VRVLVVDDRLDLGRKGASDLGCFEFAVTIRQPERDHNKRPRLAISGGWWRRVGKGCVQVHLATGREVCADDPVNWKRQGCPGSSRSSQRLANDSLQFGDTFRVLQVNLHVHVGYRRSVHLLWVSTA